MVITSSVNIDKLILTADIGEYNLLMIALLAFRDSAIDHSACDECIDHGEAIREHAAEIIESLMDQEKGIPALEHGCDCDDCDAGKSVPDWINNDNDDGQENVV